MHLVSQSVFLKTLGWSLFHSLWQMAGLWLAYFMITGGGKRFSAHVRHVIGVAMLSAGTGWFVFSLLTSPAPPRLALSFNNSSLLSSIDHYSFLNILKQFVGTFLPYCSIVYIIILVFLMARYSRYYQQCRRLKLNGLYKADPALRIFVEEVAERLGVPKKVSLWLSDVADSPMTLGFLKYVILIPIATMNHLTTSQVEAVLLHELAHIKRNDYVLNLWCTFMGLLFFFNPFSRLLIQQIRKEAENSCDDMVMQFRYDPHTYVSALLCLEKTRRQHQMAMAAVGRNNHVLLERVRRIAGYKNTFQYHTSRLVICFLFVAAVCLSLWYHPVMQTVALKKLPQRSFAAKAPLTGEIQKVFYVNNAVSLLKSKSGKPLTVTVPSKASPANAIENDLPENSAKMISNEDQDEMSAANEMIPVAVPGETREYSIAPSYPVAVPSPESAMADQFPFVPGSSFSFNIMEDTARAGERSSLAYNEKMAAVAIQKALQALDAVDWRKITMNITGNTKKGEIEKAQRALRQSLSTLNREKTDDDVANFETDEAGEQRIKEDIQLQLQALKNNRLKTPQEIQKLQQQVIQGKIKLFQLNMKKLNENLKEIEAIRKKSKIVYI